MADELYGLLGVACTCTPAELRRAWLQLARDLHPDRNPSDEAAERLGAINAAYAVLSDPRRRAEYDRYGADAASAFFVAADPPAPQAPAKPVQRGDDLEVDVEVSEREAAQGCLKEVVVRPESRCATCGGTGWRRAGRACSKCEGGRIPGIGPFSVPVPAGVTDGTVLVVRGAGRGGRGIGASRGDLRVRIRRHPTRCSDANEETLSLHVAPALLADGGVLAVGLDSGVLRVRIRARTPAGQKLRLRGRGRAGRDLVLVLHPKGDEVEVHEVHVRLA